MKIDYQNNDYDLIASFYGQKEVLPLLERALTLDLFSAIEENISPAQIGKMICADQREAALFLDVLQHAGLILKGEDFIANTPVAAKYLVKLSPFYCGSLALVNGAFLWERLAPLLGEVKGSRFVTADFPGGAVPGGEGDAPYDLILTGHLDEAVYHQATAGGIIAVVGCFAGDYGLNGAVSLYRAYRRGNPAAILDGARIAAFCGNHHLYFTPQLTLSDDFSVVFAAKNEETLAKLALTKRDQLIGALKKLDLRGVKEIDPGEVVTASWVKDHCRFGCSTYGDKCCPPNSPGYEETQTRLKDYKKAFLLEGQPPTRDFQRLMLNAEKMAFKAGYYKAFAYWAGPCSLCTECKKPEPPKKCTATRPSMESAGIDVFATVRKQGYEMRTLKDKTEFVKYFGLLLLE